MARIKSGHEAGTRAGEYVTGCLAHKAALAESKSELAGLKGLAANLLEYLAAQDEDDRRIETVCTLPSEDGAGETLAATVAFTPSRGEFVQSASEEKIKSWLRANGYEAYIHTVEAVNYAGLREVVRNNPKAFKGSGLAIDYSKPGLALTLENGLSVTAYGV